MPLLTALLGLLLGVASGAVAVAVNIPAPPPLPPVWPQVYTVSLTVDLPLLKFSQPQGLKFNMTVWYNAPHHEMRVEVLNGLDTTITTKDVEYTLYPRLNETRCGIFDIGPRAAHDEDDYFPPFLPDLSVGGWEYAGTIELEGERVQLWQSQLQEGTKTSQYTWYTAEADGRPLKFLTIGVNYFTGGHFDEYNYEFTSFKPSIVWDRSEQQSAAAAAADKATVGGADVQKDKKLGPFSPPSICYDKGERLTHRHPVALQAHALMPRVRPVTLEDAYHAYSRAMHSDAHISTGSGGSRGALVMARPHTGPRDVYARRLANFQRTAAMIHAHNAANAASGFTMRLNQWADWDDSEWLDLMLPNKARKAALLQKGPDAWPPRRTPLSTFRASLPKSKLPKEVDWRGTGADPGVKDQGMCGSCFAFAATATMEGAWWVFTGQHRSFSEQQVLDCCWDYGTSGCGGGDYQPAIECISENGGIDLEQDWPYLSNGDFCRVVNASRPGKFAGYVDIESRDEAALMEAVATLGPIAVAVDAEWPTFRYYAEGVYHDDRCRTASRELDHAVVLFGYGTTSEGVDYWLVRNTWSKFYGDDGHLKIKRGRDDCGISTDPASAVVAKDEVLPGVAERARSAAARRW